MKRRGIALLFTLSIGALLVVLTASLLALYSSDSYSQGQQQQAVQAYWNARAGVERFAHDRQIPKSGSYEFGAHGRCTLKETGTDLLFEGEYGRQRRGIVLLGGDPARPVERTP